MKQYDNKRTSTQTLYSSNEFVLHIFRLNLLVSNEKYIASSTCPPQSLLEKRAILSLDWALAESECVLLHAVRQHLIDFQTLRLEKLFSLPARGALLIGWR